MVQHACKIFKFGFGSGLTLNHSIYVGQFTYLFNFSFFYHYLIYSGAIVFKPSYNIFTTTTRYNNGTMLLYVGYHIYNNDHQAGALLTAELYINMYLRRYLYIFCNVGRVWFYGCFFWFFCFLCADHLYLYKYSVHAKDDPFIYIDFLVLF